jgi:hypothetical protein
MSVGRKQRIREHKNFIEMSVWNTGIQEHIYSSILVNKSLLICPFICRKIFQELKVDVLFPPFHEGKQAFP